MKPKIRATRPVFAFALGCLLTWGWRQPALAQLGNFVYDNTANKTDQMFAPPSGTEFGNEVIITAPNPFPNPNPQWGLTGGSFEYNSGSAPANSVVGTVTLNIYANTGPLAAGPDSQSPGPTALYTSSAIPLTASGPSGAVVTFSGWNVIVPAVFTWTVTFASPTGVTVGLDTYGPPTVGNAYNDIWRKSGSVWSLFAPDGTVQANGTPATFATFGADFSSYSISTPEPGTISLGLLCVAAFAGTVIGRQPRRPSLGGRKGSIGDRHRKSAIS